MTAQDTPAQTPEREVTKVDTISSTEAHSSDASAKGEVAGKMPSQNPESSSSVLAPSGAANIPATEDAKQPHWLTTEGTHSIPDNNMYIVLPGLMLAVFLAALDQTIVSTALPTISVELNAGPSGYAWVGTAYLLTATALIPLYGRLSDLTGRKPLLWVAIVFFLFGSALCGAAQNITWLCVARGIQGVGGGGIISLIQVIMGDITTLEQRAAFAGVFGFTWGLASVIGPLAGGALTDKVSWRWW
jgi:Major Facilitator Superfamily